MRWIHFVLVLAFVARVEASEPTPTVGPIATPEPTPVAPSLDEIRAERERFDRESTKTTELLAIIKAWSEEQSARKK